MGVIPLDPVSGSVCHGNRSTFGTPVSVTILGCHKNVSGGSVDETPRSVSRCRRPGVSPPSVGYRRGGFLSSVPPSEVSWTVDGRLDLGAP